MATAAFRWNFPPAWGDSLRTLTDILRETVFVSVEKVTRMRGSRGGPLPEVGPHGVGVGDAKGRAKGKQDVGDPERDAGVPATPTPVGAACTVNSRNPLQRRRAISMLLSPPRARQSQLVLLTCEIHGLKLKEGTRKGSQPPMLPFEDTGSRQSSRRASCARSSERQQAQPRVPLHAGTKPQKSARRHPCGPDPPAVEGAW